MDQLTLFVITLSGIVLVSFITLTLFLILFLKKIEGMADRLMVKGYPEYLQKEYVALDIQRMKQDMKDAQVLKEKEKDLIPLERLEEMLEQNPRLGVEDITTT